MRKIIKVLALLLAITILLSTPVFAADNDQVMPCESDMLTYYYSRLNVPSGNGIQVWFRVVATQNINKIGTLQIEIQRSSDGENWMTVQTYRSSDYANMLATNTGDHSSYVTHYGEYGYYYRAKVSVYGQKGFNIYTASIYSDTIYLRS